MERFSELRDRVRNGHYNVPARDVAEAILRHLANPGAHLARSWGEPSQGDR
jgi:hypothetical protein